MNSLTLFLPPKFLGGSSQHSVTQLGDFPQPPWLKSLQVRKAQMGKLSLLESHKICRSHHIPSPQSPVSQQQRKSTQALAPLH